MEGRETMNRLTRNLIVLLLIFSMLVMLTPAAWAYDALAEIPAGAQAQSTALRATYAANGRAVKLTGKLRLTKKAAKRFTAMLELDEPAVFTDVVLPSGATSTVTIPKRIAVVTTKTIATNKDNGKRVSVSGIPEMSNNVFQLSKASIKTFAAPTSVSLKASAKMKGGETLKLKATVKPSKAEQFVKWSTSNSSIATVDQSGNVTAKNKKGTVSITAKTRDGKKKAVCKITVSATTTAVTGVKVNEANVTINQGDVYGVWAVIAPITALNNKVSWTTSDPTIIQFTNTSGILCEFRGIKPGVATLTVTTADGGKKASCTVTVKAVTAQPVEGVEMAEKAFRLAQGNTKTLELETWPRVAIMKTHKKWESTDTKVATVDSNGKVTAMGPGTALIVYSNWSNADDAIYASALCHVAASPATPAPFTVSDLRFTTDSGKVFNYTMDYNQIKATFPGGTEEKAYGWDHDVLQYIYDTYDDGRGDFCDFYFEGYTKPVFFYVYAFNCKTPRNINATGATGSTLDAVVAAYGYPNHVYAGQYDDGESIRWEVMLGYEINVGANAYNLIIYFDANTGKMLVNGISLQIHRD